MSDLNDSLTRMDWVSKMKAEEFGLDDPDNQETNTSSNDDDSKEKSDDLNGKPPHSYATLIKLAISNSLRKRSTLSEIYDWIQNEFPYYKKATTGWKNSIRHNLSLSKDFLKIARTKDDPGKGCYWALNYQYINHENNCDLSVPAQSQTLNGFKIKQEHQQQIDLLKTITLQNNTTTQTTNFQTIGNSFNQDSSDIVLQNGTRISLPQLPTSPCATPSFPNDASPQMISSPIDYSISSTDAALHQQQASFVEQQSKNLHQPLNMDLMQQSIFALLLNRKTMEDQLSLAMKVNDIPNNLAATVVQQPAPIQNHLLPAVSSEPIQTIAQDTNQLMSAYWNQIVNSISKRSNNDEPLNDNPLVNPERNISHSAIDRSLADTESLFKSSSPCSDINGESSFDGGATSTDAIDAMDCSSPGRCVRPEDIFSPQQPLDDEEFDFNRERRRSSTNKSFKAFNDLTDFINNESSLENNFDWNSILDQSLP